MIKCYVQLYMLYENKVLYSIVTFLTVKLNVTTGNDDQFKATSSKTQQTADLFRLEDGRKGSKVMLTEQSDVLLDPPVLCLCQSDLNFISVLA